jgi:hypothetical protein
MRNSHEHERMPARIRPRGGDFDIVIDNSHRSVLISAHPPRFQIITIYSTKTNRTELILAT